MVTQKFVEVNHGLFECDWYLFPIEIQRKYLPIILMNTQKTVKLRGFGNIDITRETFKKVSIFERQRRKINFDQSQKMLLKFY